MQNKEAIIAEIRLLLAQLAETGSEEHIQRTTDNTPVPVMLTIQECTAEFKGLSAHTVRKLVKQDKVSYIRAGEGSRGKILVNKDSLSEYLGANR